GGAKVGGGAGEGVVLVELAGVGVVEVAVAVVLVDVPEAGLGERPEFVAGGVGVRDGSAGQVAFLGAGDAVDIVDRVLHVEAPVAAVDGAVDVVHRGDRVAAAIVGEGAAF